MIGKCVSGLAASMPPTSSVFRVAVSKVRMPRSQRITRSSPAAITYSAAPSHSSTVEPAPRLRRTGRPARPTARSRSKFCMLRAPICSTSAFSATGLTWSTAITSVTTGRPVDLPAATSQSRASRPWPWKAYGLVRGLKIPPRSAVAPQEATSRAMRITCSALSTEHGPAITARAPAPMRSGPTSTTVGALRAVACGSDFTTGSVPCFGGVIFAACAAGCPSEMTWTSRAGASACSRAASAPSTHIRTGNSALPASGRRVAPVRTSSRPVAVMLLVRKKASETCARA